MSHSAPTGIVEFDRVTKRYAIGRRRAHLAAALPLGHGVGTGETLAALDDVSFTISPGESFALIGANGAGKSTALKCLAGIVRPTSGRVRTGGRIVSLIELGVGFHPDLTGIDNARFAAAVAGVHGRVASGVVDEAIDFSEIGQFADTPVKRYSSGMYARLSFGIAAALPADILIVDEILAVGDLAFQRKCYSRLREVRENRGTTLVFVSHNEWVLKEVCQRGALLRRGRLEATAPISELIAMYHAQTGAAAEGFIPGEGQRMVLRRVTTVPEDARVIKMHEPVSVECDVEVGAEVQDGVVGVVLFDAESRIIWGVYSDEQGMTLAPGVMTIRVDIDDVSVLPGPCRLQVFAFDRRSPVVEDLRHMDLIVEGSVPRNPEHGVVHVESRWAQRPGGSTSRGF